MVFIKVIAVLLGLAFLLFGYFIYFRGKYGLINGFEADRKDESYARRVGLVELVVGAVLLACGIVLIVFV